MITQLEKCQIVDALGQNVLTRIEETLHDSVMGDDVADALREDIDKVDTRVFDGFSEVGSDMEVMKGDIESIRETLDGILERLPDKD